jgi:hypothetical protein
MFGVSALDPTTFVATAAALVLVTITASSFRRSEPSRSMRCPHYGTNEIRPVGARHTAR